MRQEVAMSSPTHANRDLRFSILLGIGVFLSALWALNHAFAASLTVLAIAWLIWLWVETRECLIDSGVVVALLAIGRALSGT
jgi:hypothetical protein